MKVISGGLLLDIEPVGSEAVDLHSRNLKHSGRVFHPSRVRAATKDWSFTKLGDTLESFVGIGRTVGAQLVLGQQLEYKSR